MKGRTAEPLVAILEFKLESLTNTWVIVNDEDDRPNVGRSGRRAGHEGVLRARLRFMPIEPRA